MKGNKAGQTRVNLNSATQISTQIEHILSEYRIEFEPITIENCPFPSHFLRECITEKENV